MADPQEEFVFELLCTVLYEARERTRVIRF